jgi:hypothetical protein
MKYFIKLFSLFFILALVFGGCSSITQPEPEPGPDTFDLLTDGRWKLEGTMGIDTCTVRGINKYNSDYTGAVYCARGDTILVTFSWGLEDNDKVLVFTINSETEHATIQKLTKTEMNLHWIERDVGHYYTKVVEE